MSDEKLEFNLPPVPSELLNSEDSRNEDTEESEEPTTFEPPPPPSAAFSEGASSPPPQNYRPPAYSEEHTFFPPPPAPPSPPAASQPSQPDFQSPAAQPPAALTAVQPTVVQPTVVQSNAAGQNAPGPNPATIDPLLQYRGEEEDYYQQESVAQPPRERRSARRYRAGRPSARFWLQFAIMLGVIVLAVVMLRVLVFESFYITSDSMAPTLNTGDRILVNKLSSGGAGRGDLVVFSRPENDDSDSEDDLVKRVVALEGETVTFSEGRIFIGELLLLEPYLEEGEQTRVAPGNRFFDACVNQISSRSCTIAPGHVYVLGDSRNFSYDSRFFGPVPNSSIVGRAFWRVWPLGEFGGV